MAPTKNQKISGMSATSKRGAPIKFPDRDRMNNANPFALIEREKVIALYNKANKSHMVRLSDTVAEWFKQEAKNNGWEAVQAIMYGTTKKAGFVLWVAAHTNVSFVHKMEIHHR